MDADFWHRKWANADIGFHEGAVNPLLVEHWPAMSLDAGARVFLPLCGKTVDIHWLLANGYRVAGAELSRLAVDQLFAELGVEPVVSRHGPVEHHGAPGLDILVGDIFQVSAQMLGAVDAIYDRAALVALPEDMRRRYTAHLTEITAAAPQLLVCFEYDQSLMAGPPFSIPGEEVIRHYREAYAVTLLDRVEIPGGFRGRLPAQVAIWRLEPRTAGTS
jgi:thiopurine S-methyltransferase